MLWLQLTPHLYMLPLTCLGMLPLIYIRGQGFVGCSWGILRFFDIQAISHQEALEVLSFLKPDFSLVFVLSSLVPLVSHASLVLPVSLSL